MRFVTGGRCRLLGILILATTVKAAPVDPWEAARVLDFRAAAAAFGAEAGDDARLAEAAALLSAQPRTTANTERALRLVRGVGPGAEPRLAQAARYLEARILHEHLEPAQPDAARRIYEALLAENPGAAAAEAAVPLVQLLLLDHSQPLDQRWLAVEAVLARVQDPVARRNVQYFAGRAGLHVGVRGEQVRPHLQAAAEAGFRVRQRSAELWLTVAQLADEAGARADAVAAYRQFIALIVRDTRIPLVQERIARLEGAR